MFCTICNRESKSLSCLHPSLQLYITKLHPRNLKHDIQHYKQKDIHYALQQHPTNCGWHEINNTAVQINLRHLLSERSVHPDHREESHQLIRFNNTKKNYIERVLDTKLWSRHNLKLDIYVHKTVQMYKQVQHFSCGCFVPKQNKVPHDVLSRQTYLENIASWHDLSAIVIPLLHLVLANNIINILWHASKRNQVPHGFVFIQDHRSCLFSSAHTHLSTLSCRHT